MRLREANGPEPEQGGDIADLQLLPGSAQARRFASRGSVSGLVILPS
jgi:hypothetical protein